MATPQVQVYDDPSRPTRLEYNAGLDGLRGFALVAILFYHSGTNWIPGAFLSVSTFFTLSGFLITSLLLYEWENSGRIDMLRFWSHRLRRLLPGALLALAVVALLGGTIGDASQLARLRGDGLAALFYVSNWRFIYLGNDYADLFASPSLVQHFWSLSIEEQFYLLFPPLGIVLLRFGSRRIFAWVVIALTLLSTAWMALLFEPDLPTSRLYFGSDTRAAELLLGTVLALWHAGRPPLRRRARNTAVALGGLGLASNLYFWFFVSMETPWLWQGGYLLYAITTGAIILGTLQPRGLARATLSWGPLPWVGKLSYGLYLYHFCLYVTLTPELTGLAPVPLFVARVAATFALAVPSYYWLEQPVRRSRMITGWRPWLATPVATVAVVAMLLFATLDPPEPSVDLTDLSDEQKVFIVGTGPRVMIVGGSISFNVGKGLLRWAVRTKAASVFNVARKGCGISRGGRVANALKRGADRCDDWPQYWERWIRRFEPDVVIVHVGMWESTERTFSHWGTEPRSIGDELYDDWLLSEHEAAVDFFRSHGAEVIWLTTPCSRVRFGADPVWHRERASRLNDSLQRLKAKRGEDLELVDFDAKLCPEGEFTTQLAGMDDIRPDGIHLSNEAADWVANWLGELVVASRATR